MIEAAIIMVLFLLLLTMFAVATHQAEKIRELERRLSWEQTAYGRLLSKFQVMKATKRD